MQHIIFYTHVHACCDSLSYTDEIEIITVDSETVCLWLVGHSYNRVI